MHTTVRPSIGLVETERNVEQLKQSGPGLVRRWSRGCRCDGKSDSSEARRYPEPRRPAPNDATWVGGEFNEGLSNTSGSVSDGRDPREIDANRPMPDLSHGCDMRVNQAGFSEPPWRGEANCDAIGGSPLEAVQFATTIDEPRGRHRPLIIERIHRTLVYGQAGHQMPVAALDERGREPHVPLATAIRLLLEDSIVPR